MFGVAPSAAAAEVLGAETGADADTIDKLLAEHALHQLHHQRAQLIDQLNRLRCELHDLPNRIRLANHDHTRATQTLVYQQRQRLSAAGDFLDRHDRPFHRRGHKDEIAAARDTLERLPGQIRKTVRTIDHYANVVDDLRAQHRGAHHIARTRQPAWESQLHDIEDRLHAQRAVSGLRIHTASHSFARIGGDAASRAPRHDSPDFGISL